MDIIEQALNSTAPRYSQISELRRACSEFRRSSADPDGDVLEYLMTNLYHDWGLARYVLNHYTRSLDKVEQEISHLAQTGNYDEASAFWDIMEMHLQDAVDPES